MPEGYALPPKGYRETRAAVAKVMAGKSIYRGHRRERKTPGGKGGSGITWLGITEKLDPEDISGLADAITAAEYKINQSTGHTIALNSFGSGEVTILTGREGVGSRITIYSVIPAIIPYQKLVLCSTVDGKECIISIVGS